MLVWGERDRIVPSSHVEARAAATPGRQGRDLLPLRAFPAPGRAGPVRCGAGGLHHVDQRHPPQQPVTGPAATATARPRSADHRGDQEDLAVLGEQGGRQRAARSRRPGRRTPLADADRQRCRQVGGELGRTGTGPIRSAPPPRRACRSSWRPPRRPRRPRARSPGPPAARPRTPARSPGPRPNPAIARSVSSTGRPNGCSAASTSSRPAGDQQVTAGRHHQPGTADPPLADPGGDPARRQRPTGSAIRNRTSTSAACPRVHAAAAVCANSSTSTRVTSRAAPAARLTPEGGQEPAHPHPGRVEQPDRRTALPQHEDRPARPAPHRSSAVPRTAAPLRAGSGL